MGNKKRKNNRMLDTTTPVRAVSPKAFYGNGPGYASVFSVSYNGEKNLGEIGPIKHYMLDHDGLRLRSWQLYLESEICQTVFKRFATWVIGSGLKLQAEPQKSVLQSEKINLDVEDFNKSVEDRFKIFAASVYADYSEQENLHAKAKEAFINAIVGGDTLVILRYIDGFVKVQLIDGAHVKTPLNMRFAGKDYVTAEGNRIRHGVEIDSRGRHVAYWVCQPGGLYERITARGEKTGALMAFMVYGLKYRLDNVRGIPLISAVMETAKKMERYKEATLGSAEERQKIPYTVEHDVSSTGENPFAKQLAKAFTVDESSGDIPHDVSGKALADTIAATTNKMTFNMPIGAKLSTLKSENELYFKDFYTINIHLVCSTIGIPPEVALAKYDSNFSASRAALKDWEHTINVNRNEFAGKYYKNVYSLWLDTEVLTNKIDAPGYLTVLSQQNIMALEAYRFARFIGVNVPHIDPLKEVEAERLKLGTAAAHIPLGTVEASTEALNGGDASANMMQFSQELAKADSLNIKGPAVVAPTG